MTTRETFLQKLALEGKEAAINWIQAQVISLTLRGESTEGFFGRSDMVEWQNEILREDNLAMFQVFWELGWRSEDSWGMLRADMGIVRFLWEHARESCLKRNLLPSDINVFLSTPPDGVVEKAYTAFLPELFKHPQWREALLKHRFTDLVRLDPGYFQYATPQVLDERLAYKAFQEHVLQRYLQWLQQNGKNPKEDAYLMRLKRDLLSDKSFYIGVANFLAGNGLLTAEETKRVAIRRFIVELDGYTPGGILSILYSAGLTVNDLPAEQLARVENHAIEVLANGRTITWFEELEQKQHIWKCPRAAEFIIKFVPPQRVLRRHYYFIKHVFSTCNDPTERARLLRLLGGYRKEGVISQLLDDGLVDAAREFDYSFMAVYIPAGKDTALLQRLLAAREWKLPSLLQTALKAQNNEFTVALVQAGSILKPDVLLAAASSGNVELVAAADAKGMIAGDLYPKLYRIAAVNRQHKMLDALASRAGDCARDILELLPKYFQRPEASVA